MTPASEILPESDGEAHAFTSCGVRQWTQQFPVQVAWNLSVLEADSRAGHCMKFAHGDRKPFQGAQT